MLPLHGIRVLDFSRVLAGPYATMILADLGAEVIKVETPGTGDDSRSYGPFIGEESAYFLSINRNKKSITLNLKSASGVQIVKDLVKQSDMVIENFRPGAMDRLGLGYEALKAINPRIIYAACSGFGYTGPYSQRAAYDIIVQGMGGIMSVNGQPDGPPTRVGASVGDITAGMYTVIGALAALEERHKSGLGQFIDVAMLDCQLSILENALARYFITGKSPGRLGNTHPTITPFTSFETRDGMLIVGAGNDSLFQKLCVVIGRPGIGDDPRFKTNALRTHNWPDLEVLLQSAFMEKTAAEWIGILDSKGIPCGPINTIADVVANPQVVAREVLVEVDHPLAGKHIVAGPPYKFSRTQPEVVTAAPVLGADTRDILSGLLGMTEEEIEQADKDGCFVL